MKNIRLGLVTLLTVALASIASAQSALDPAFQVTTINGDCQVSTPFQDDFEPAQDAKAYPYGTAIRTGARSSMVLVLSDGNTVRVLANARVVMDENASNSKIKTVKLSDGEVEVKLNNAFHKGGNKLNVETATAICGAVGTEFSVASREEDDLRIVLFRVIKGVINVYGDSFEVKTLDASDFLSVLSPADRSFLRLQNMKGEFDITIKDQDMNDKNLPTQEGNVLKIWQRRVPESNERIITAHFNDPEGNIIEEIIVTMGGGQPPLFGDEGESIWDPNDIPTNDDVRDNPLPPEDVMIEMIDRVDREENVEVRVGTVTPPTPPTPTPVGRR